MNYKKHQWKWYQWCTQDICIEKKRKKIKALHFSGKIKIIFILCDLLNVQDTPTMYN